jgi:hypothetical protein
MVYIDFISILCPCNNISLLFVHRSSSGPAAKERKADNSKPRERHKVSRVFGVHKKDEVLELETNFQILLRARTRARGEEGCVVQSTRYKKRNLETPRQELYFEQTQSEGCLIAPVFFLFSKKPVGGFFVCL